MRITQISIFVENHAGAMLEVTEALYKENIDIKALTLADTKDYGILRLIVSDPAKAAAALKAKGITFTSTDVLAAKLEDRPGGLHRVLAALDGKNINFEYVYAFITPVDSDAYAVFRVSDFEGAAAAFEEAGIEMMDGKRLYAI